MALAESEPESVIEPIVRHEPTPRERALHWVEGQELPEPIGVLHPDRLELPEGDPVYFNKEEQGYLRVLRTRTYPLTARQVVKSYVTLERGSVPSQTENRMSTEAREFIKGLVALGHVLEIPREVTGSKIEEFKLVSSVLKDEDSA